MACRVLKNGTYTVTQGYSSSHLGIDIVSGSYSADSIIAHSDGTVMWCQTGQSNAQGATGNASYGNCVKILHANGYRTLYAHLSSVYFATGDTVKKGDVIGYMGNTGNSYGTHLHFEVRNTSDSRINPTSYLTSSLPNMESDDTAVTIETVETAWSTGSVSYKSSYFASSSVGYDCEIFIENSGKIYVPVLVDSVTVQTSRKGSPSSLNFSCYVDDVLEFANGNCVGFTYMGDKVFYGYIFSIKQSDENIVEIQCYDQLRYFTNKTAMSYSDKKYSELLEEICSTYGLNVGEIEDTSFTIGARIEENSLFDILGNASDETYNNTGKLYILYDDYGKLSLLSTTSLIVPLLIDESTMQSYEYNSSIDSDVYTKITLAKDNSETGVTELFIANDSDAQENFGILEYYSKDNSLSDTELEAMAQDLLDSYSGEKMSLSLKKCLGDIRVRAGTSVVVQLKLKSSDVYSLMMVEKAVHNYSENLHTMDLYLSGAGFSFD
ncbi:MAG: M23 family metallopeptidase [Clostridia bacterium]